MQALSGTSASAWPTPRPPGNIFAAPSPEVIANSIRLADHGLGVVLAYGNYMGDVLNCRLAARWSRPEA